LGVAIRQRFVFITPFLEEVAVIMDIFLGISFVAILILVALAFLFEYRIRQPDVLVLHESNGDIRMRQALVYPRHFSLALKRTTCPIQLNIEATAAGNLGVGVKLVGAVAPSLEHLQALIRVGGWNSEVVARAADEAKTLLETLVKEHTESCEIHALSSSGLLVYLNERSTQFSEKYGVELISLAVQSLEPTDPDIADALRQQEQARLLEQTERLNHLARVAAARAKYQADEDIAEMEHALELKKAGLNKALLEEEAALAQRRLKDELERNRLRLAFEREELEMLKNNPELLVLTPQAARLAEASQSLKNARTVISLTPSELVHGSELLGMFQSLLQKALEARNASDQQDG
jgi:hypothetical protein